MHKQPLHNDDSLDLIPIGTAIVVDKMISHLYPYTNLTIDDLPRSLTYLRTAGAYLCDSREIIRIGLKRAPPPTSASSKPSQANFSQIVRFNDNLQHSSNNSSFIESHYICIDMCLTLNHVIDVQHTLQDAGAEQSRQLYASFCRQNFYSSNHHISIKTVPPFIRSKSTSKGEAYEIKAGSRNG